MPKGYPRTLLAQIGRVAVTSALIEQETILHASAMAAQLTEGDPKEFLRMSFIKLRRRWLHLCRANFDARTLSRFLEPLNEALATAWTERGHVIHGQWRVVERGKFEVSWWEQKHRGLEDFKVSYTLAEITAFADHLDGMLKQIKRFHA